MKMSRGQQSLVDLFWIHPSGFIYDDGGWEWRFREPGGRSFREDGRVVHSLQKRNIIVARKNPSGPGLVYHLLLDDKPAVGESR